MQKKQIGLTHVVAGFGRKSARMRPHFPFAVPLSYGRKKREKRENGNAFDLPIIRSYGWLRWAFHLPGKLFSDTVQ